MKTAFAALVLTAAVSASAQTPIPDIIPTPPGPAPQSLLISSSVPPQFQLRRQRLAQVVLGLKEKNPAAGIALDKILTDYESAPLRYTPLESLDIIGLYYLPRDGIEQNFSLIVLAQVLGWYDVLRYSSPSGRVEIGRTEFFFNRPLLVAGPAVAARSQRYLQEHPVEARAMLAKGFQYAAALRETQNYDRHWPAYYGLEHLSCVFDQTTCTALPEVDRSKWSEAFIEAKERVTAYYGLDKSLAK